MWACCYKVNDVGEIKNPDAKAQRGQRPKLYIDMCNNVDLRPDFNRPAKGSRFC